MAELTQIRGDLKSAKIQNTVEYGVLSPEGFKTGLPLVVVLHGGGSDRESVFQYQPYFERLMRRGVLSECLVAMPTIPGESLYLNMRQGGERWEDFLIQEFVPRIRRIYGTRRRILMFGSSMAGCAALRLAFRYSDQFRAVAAIAPSIEPVLKWEDLRDKHRFWRKDALFEKVFGKPVDELYWEDSHPANVASQNRKAIIENRLQIYIESGDKDQLWTYEGAEFLHRILWRERIRHEYHLVRGADHVGPSLPDRIEEALRFLARSLDPWSRPTEEQIKNFVTPARLMASQLDETDHYNQPGECPPEI